MKVLRLTAVLLLPALSILAAAHSSQPIPVDTARKYFAEAQSLCQSDHGRLWGISLCGPIMFVDPGSRYVVANQADAIGLLRADAGVFVGHLPADQNIANTAVEWSGVLWTQMLWPLPPEERERETLIAHELFHRIQGQLNFPKSREGENPQLDTLEGRYTLQLEWRAWRRALEAQTDEDRKKAAGDALLFREERYRLFPDAAAQEQSLEMNEGLAEYTGVRLGNPTVDEQVKEALKDLSGHSDDPTFVRSFAYATGPALGLLLDRYAPAWRSQLKTGESLDVMLRNAILVPPHSGQGPSILQQAFEERAAQYGGPALRAAEAARESKRQQVIAAYRAKFVDGPVLILKFFKMQVQFDPRNLQPLEGFGTVYPNLRISDKWGVLEVKNGALMNPDWSAVTVVAPSVVVGSSLKGDGWTLELNPGWKVVPGERRGDYKLQSEP
jgi:hypothetical protein